MDERTANLLGALSLAAADRVTEVAEKEINYSGATPAALVVLAMAPGISNERLRSILKLSHPACVRLINRLSAEGLVERRSASDGRAVALHLTRKGQKSRRALLKQREAALLPILSPLSADEREVLGTLLHKMIAALPIEEVDRLSICRLCNETVCSDCPLPCTEIEE